MASKLLTSLLLAAALAAGAAQPAKPAPPPEATLKKLLWALQINYLEKYVEDGDANFKAWTTREQLGKVYGELGDRLKAGYSTEYLGGLDKGGCQVHLWRLRMKDGGDDLLAKLAVKGEKVVNFALE